MRGNVFIICFNPKTDRCVYTGFTSQNVSGGKRKSISYEPYIRDAVDLNSPRVARIDTIVRSRTCNQIHRM